MERFERPIDIGVEEIDESKSKFSFEHLNSAEMVCYTLSYAPLDMSHEARHPSHHHPHPVYNRRHMRGRACNAGGWCYFLTIHSAARGRPITLAVWVVSSWAMSKRTAGK